MGSERSAPTHPPGNNHLLCQESCFQTSSRLWVPDLSDSGALCHQPRQEGVARRTRGLRQGRGREAGQQHLLLHFLGLSLRDALLPPTAWGLLYNLMEMFTLDNQKQIKAVICFRTDNDFMLSLRCSKHLLVDGKVCPLTAPSHHRHRHGNTVPSPAVSEIHMEHLPILRPSHRLPASKPLTGQMLKSSPADAKCPHSHAPSSQGHKGRDHPDSRDNPSLFPGRKAEADGQEPTSSLRAALLSQGPELPTLTGIQTQWRLQIRWQREHTCTQRRAGTGVWGVGGLAVGFLYPAITVNTAITICFVQI